jgi:hypothetical protein
MARQTIHQRVSVKGKPFIAGSQPIPAPVVMGPNRLMIVANIPHFRRLIRPLRKTFMEAKLEFGDGHLKTLASLGTYTQASTIIYDLTNHNGISIRAEKPMSISINMSSLDNAISELKNDEVVRFDVSEDVHKLILSTDLMRTRLPLLELEKPLYDLSKLTFKFKASVNAEELNKAIEALKKINKKFILASGPKGLTLSSKNEFSTDEMKEITLDSNPLPVSEMKIDSEALLSISSLLNKETTTCLLEWGTELESLKLTLSGAGYNIQFIMANPHWVPT